MAFDDFGSARGGMTLISDLSNEENVQKYCLDSTREHGKNRCTQDIMASYRPSTKQLFITITAN